MKRKQGFTLIELLVVMAIIAILASIVVPNVVGWIGRARMTRAQSEIQGIELALAKMLTDAGRNSLHEFFEPVQVQAAVAARVANPLVPGTTQFTTQGFREVQNLYTRACYALLRIGRGVLQDSTLDFPVAVYKRDVVKSLSDQYMNIGFDPWGNLYQIYPSPWPLSNGLNVFRTFAQANSSGLPGGGDLLPDLLSSDNASSTVQADFLNEYSENVVGYPAPRKPNVAFIWSFGENMVSGQAMYQTGAVYNVRPAEEYYDPSQDTIFRFGGDDINNWDSQTSWSRFYS